MKSEPPGPPAGEIGEVRMTHHGGPMFTIDQADPRIRIAAELLEEIADGRLPLYWEKCATVTRRCDCAPPSRCAHYEKLEIRGSNARYVYRITGLLPDGSYLAEWPD